MGRARWSNRLLVEQCRALIVEAMRRDGVFRSQSGSSWTLSWLDSYRNPIAQLDYWVIRDETLWLQFGKVLRDGPYRRIALSGEQRIQITASRPHFGGSRYWFVCGCGRRVGRLYLAPGRQAFACRRCNNLTYKSCREHDARVYKLARDSVALDAALDAALTGGTLVWGRLAGYAALLQYKRALRRG